MATGTQEIPQSVQADPDDVLLVKRFQRGEESAFNDLVIRHQTAIYQLAQRYVKTHEDTLDITQDVFLKAYRGLLRFNGRCQFLHGSTVLPSTSASIIHASKSGAEREELILRNLLMICWPRSKISIFLRQQNPSKPKNCWLISEQQCYSYHPSNTKFLSCVIRIG